MIKNIVFDMGNVLTIYNARDYIFSDMWITRRIFAG